jgi:hypothetical protein
LLLKLGIKEVVWQKMVTNFQILSFLYKYFIENRGKLLYAGYVALLTLYYHQEKEELLTYKQFTGEKSVGVRSSISFTKF